MERVLDECVEKFPNIWVLKQAILTSSKGRGGDSSDWSRKEFNLPISSARQQQIKDNVVVLVALPSSSLRNDQIVEREALGISAVAWCRITEISPRSIMPQVINELLKFIGLI